MKQLTCRECGEPVLADDRFCAICGTPSGPAAPGDPIAANGTDASGAAGAANGTASGPQEVPAGSGESGSAARPRPAAAPPRPAPPPEVPFFRHMPPPQPAARMTNDTRYLCAAAYHDAAYTNTVIRELLGSRRAVARSVGIDLGAVLRHCLRARRLLLIRDIIFVALVFIFLIASPLTTLEVIFITLMLGYVLPHFRWSRRGWAGRIVTVLAFLSVISVLGTLFAGLLFAAFLSAVLTSGALSGGSLGGAGSAALGSLAAFVLLLAATWATEFGYRLATLRTLTEDLRPGQPPPPPGHGPAQARIAQVEAAQHGNVTLYGEENPFIGTGEEVDRHWSIATELLEAPSRVPGPDGPAGRTLPRVYTTIDPVELHDVIRRRLLDLADPALPPNERVAGLVVDDHMVGSGLLPWDSPLIDGAAMVPYSQASTEAIEALIRHPQAGVRYYQRASVIDWGPPVTSGGRTVVGDTDQGISVSAFVYAAVEGRMFYLEFVRTALPPVHPDYRWMDRWTGSSGNVLAAALLGLRWMFYSAARSPAGIIAALRTMRHEHRIRTGTRHAYGSAFGDFGAHVSVRELGAYDYFGTYIRLLDVEKYTRVIERLLLDTVLDFLDSKGVDISAFRASAGNITNNVAYGGNNMFGGEGNTFKQQVKQDG